jgi:hypothetical protein
MPPLDATPPPTDTVELTLDDLKNRADQRLSWVRRKGPSPMAASANVLEQPLSSAYVLKAPGTLVAR